MHIMPKAGLGELMSCYESGADLPVPAIPCHSQNIERAVKATTEAASKAIGYANRHAMIIKLIKIRDEIPLNASKADFLNLQ